MSDCIRPIDMLDREMRDRLAAKDAELARLRAYVSDAQTVNAELLEAVASLRAQLDDFRRLDDAGYAELARLRRVNEGLVKVLRDFECPHPANRAPDHLTVEECMGRLECGCDLGDAVAQATGQRPNDDSATEKGEP